LTEVAHDLSLLNSMNPHLTQEYFMAPVQQFLREESGATAVEYAVMLALILMALIVGVKSVGNSTSGIWADNQTKLEAAGF